MLLRVRDDGAIRRVDNVQVPLSAPLEKLPVLQVVETEDCIGHMMHIALDIGARTRMLSCDVVDVGKTTLLELTKPALVIFVLAHIKDPTLLFTKQSQRYTPAGCIAGAATRRF